MPINGKTKDTVDALVTGLTTTEGDFRTGMEDIIEEVDDLNSTLFSSDTNISNSQLVSKVRAQISASALSGIDGIDYNSSTGVISHHDTSDQASISATNNTYVSNIALDVYGHVTGMGTQTISAGNNISISDGGNITHDTLDVSDVTETAETYLSGLTFDNYGHVSATDTATLPIASSSVRGLASFNADFDANASGEISMATPDTGGTIRGQFSAGEGIDISSAGVISGEDASATNKGVASFNTDFAVTDGAVAMATPATGGTIRGQFSAGEGIDISGAGVISGEDASATNKGVASFSSDDFSVSSGAVSLATPASGGAVRGQFSAGDGINISAAGVISAHQGLYDAGTLVANSEQDIKGFSDEDFNIISGVLNIKPDAIGFGEITNVTGGTYSGTPAVHTDGTGTILGRISSGTGDPEALTPTQARSVMNVEDGATNTEHPAIYDSSGTPTLRDGITAAEVRTAIGFDEAAQDAIGAAISSGTQSGVSVSYSDTDNSISFNVADPTITLTGDATGSATMTNLGDVSIATTISDAEIRGRLSAGEGINFSGGEISGEDATTTNKGIASFSGSDFNVSSGAVTLDDSGVRSRFTAGNGVSISAGGEISLTNAHAAETVIFQAASLAAGITARNAARAAGWNTGDIAIITDNSGNDFTSESFIYIGSNNNTSATTNADWTELTFTSGENTTYTFTSGTNGGFSVTPSGGTAQSVTVGHPSISAASSSNNSGRVGIQDITLDSNGHVTGLTTATFSDTNTNRLTTFVIEDGDGTEVTMSHGKELKFVEGNAIDINFTDTSPGSDADPYDLTISHQNVTRSNSTGTQSPSSGSTFTAIDSITTNSQGHVTGVRTSTITLPVDPDTNTTYSVYTGQSADGGYLVPDRDTSTTTRYLREDGTWSIPPDTNTNTQLSTEQVQDIVGGMVSGNTESNISVTYNDSTGKLNFAATDTNTNQLTTFQVEDGDGTEVTISHGKEWKFVEGGGVDINWTDTSPGSDSDPYDLTFTLDLDGISGGSLTGTTIADGDVLAVADVSAVGDVTKKITASNLRTYMQSGIDAGGASVTVSDSAPSSPSDGDLWYYQGGSNEGARLFVYIDDDSAWVDAAPAGQPGEAGADGTSFGWKTTGQDSGNIGGGQSGSTQRSITIPAGATSAHIRVSGARGSDRGTARYYLWVNQTTYTAATASAIILAVGNNGDLTNQSGALILDLATGAITHDSFAISNVTSGAAVTSLRVGGVPTGNSRFSYSSNCTTTFA